MKSSVFIALISLVTFSRVSLAQTDIKESSLEIPTRIELKVGERYVLKLQGLGAAGYTWEYTVEGIGKVVAVSKDRSDASPQTETGEPLPLGYSREELVTIKALEPGHITIRFVQHRPWEKDKPPLKEHVLEVYIENPS
jgi:predicted secreted protein